MRSIALARALVPAVLSFATPAVAQTTWYVDGAATPPGNGTQASPYTSIQYAITQSTTVDGDRIEVAGGVYTEPIRFLGKCIVVRGTGGPALTVIDMLGTAATAVSFVDGERPGARIEGFTIRGAKNAFGNPVIFGGGVACEGSHAEVRDCVLADHGASVVDAFHGAAAAVRGGGRLNLVRTTVLNNRADGAGGALFVDAGTLRMDGCLVTDSWSYNGGGAIAATQATVDISNCEFRDNVSGESRGGALYATGSLVRVVDSRFYDNNASNGPGGALAVVDSTTLVERSTFVGGVSSGGGAIYSDGVGGLLVDECSFRENTACQVHGSTWEGHAVFAAGGGVLTRSVFYRNGLPCGTFSRGAVSGATLERCTLVENACSPIFDGAAARDSTLVNCIVWGNQPTALSLANCATSYSDVDAGASGPGDFNSPPLFVDQANGDLRLLAGSPCIDAGDPVTALDLDGSRADVGAHAFYSDYGAPLTQYCTAKVTSNGCVPYITAGSAPPSLSGGMYEVTARNTPENRPGLMFWGLQPATAPFQGGVLCVATPRRTPIQTSTLEGGLAGCAGKFVFRWTSTYAALAGAAPGASLYCQFWFRDPSDPQTVGLSNAAQFTALP